ncbi:hypothetical protein [Streptomyces sp. TRM70350]|uniref:hypothetical protein n=1 Tax=Streptomyces sp. TRM70350 TaxID=2856165 RepID=UPI0021106346|nr:hypothetical protein [Streptomyces sp. TRM70350]
MFLAALIILGCAALVAAVATRPPVGWGFRWRFPLVVVLIAAADAGLVVMAATRSDRQTGLISLLAAGLLVCGTQRRMRAVRRL